ncbi:DUF6107 family protein [Mycoplana sp. MJR14]|uniref:DUF6107 family protein n=1 Tax=Mycoplana sp. MJR14 TaxID=3032583 RepID=UPI000DD66779|nr:DUF6107 family protein [Mycoplana sp. MJR14]MDF1631976.1 DUF6107 family protein [Mycoplana sp. MJR14]
MADFGNDASLWAARWVGSAAGAAVSLVYMLPKGRREAASRFVTGLTCGMIFGGPVGVWLATRLEIAAFVSRYETTLAGSAAASLTAWWGLGVLMRAAERMQGGGRQ